MLLEEAALIVNRSLDVRKLVSSIGHTIERQKFLVLLVLLWLQAPL